MRVPLSLFKCPERCLSSCLKLHLHKEFCCVEFAVGGLPPPHGWLHARLRLIVKGAISSRCSEHHPWVRVRLIMLSLEAPCDTVWGACTGDQCAQRWYRKFGEELILKELPKVLSLLEGQVKSVINRRVQNLFVACTSSL